MKMETKNNGPTAKPAATTNNQPATPPGNRPLKPRSFMRRRGLWLIGALIVTGAGVFGYLWAFGKPKVIYTTAAVERGDLESTVVAAGIVQPIKYVDVGAQTSGVLKSLKVKRGDQVAQDQLIAEIDPALADTALTAAAASLENITAQRSVKQAQLVLAKRQLARDKVLFAKQVITASELDISQSTYKVASADVAALSAQMKQAKAAVGTATTNLGYTKIMAPMAGEVVSISLLEGQVLNANQQAPVILRIADISTVTVWAQVSEADIVRVKPDQDVYFTVLGSPQRWDGKVRQILPTPELINSVVFYDVLFDIPNPGRELKIQMTAQVYIILAQAKGVLMIPAAAVASAGEGTEAKVKVLKANGTVELRTIKIGIKSELLAEVTDGLKEKELVVLREIKPQVKKSNALTGSGSKGR
jgi:membrane fusion protein, macrolide-specific efflux system